jgi:hypothetical protein
LGLSTRIRELIADLREEWQTLNERITAFDAEFVSRARTDEAARRLATIPGIGKRGRAFIFIQRVRMPNLFSLMLPAVPPASS